MRRGALLAGVALAMVVSVPTAAAKTKPDRSLYTGPAPRPGPAILYESVANAPQLRNTGIWHAKPILISGTEAYRQGEFLYQDYLYDDHGAHEVADPTDPQLGGADVSDLFSMPNGTYDYPTGPGYASDAADLVEFRVKPLKNATAFRITLNTLENQALVAFSIAIGGTPGTVYPFPDGANVNAPAQLFLTVRPVNGKLTAQLVHAGTDAPVTGPNPTTTVSMLRRQIQVEIPHREWNPRNATVRFAMGVGLWNAKTRSYLLPGASATATTPGGAGVDPHPAAFFNVAFRTDEPIPSLQGSVNDVLNASWWRDRDQGEALAANNISSLFADVSFKKLHERITDNADVPRTGSFDMILPSHFEPAQGANFTKPCGLTGNPLTGGCAPSYLGQLQPFNIYVPPGPAPKDGYGLTLLLHSLSANYNQFMGSHNQSEFGDRPNPSIVITPEARGPDQYYEGLAASDVFEVWAMVSRLYKLNPAYTDIAGYSMGGIGTFTLAEQFPDLFARAQPTVGYSTDEDAVASLRNIPVLMWNNSADELVNPALYLATETALNNDNYRYELDVFRPCASALCSPLFPDHLELAINDQFAPAATFLGSATVERNPAHITFVEDAQRNLPQYGLVGNHAYWLSNITLRNPSAHTASGLPEAKIDAVSGGFGQGEPTPSNQKIGVGNLVGGAMGPLLYASFTKTWGPVPATAATDSITIDATNVATVAINTQRARVNCEVTLKVTTDGPITITLPGCHRVAHVA